MPEEITETSWGKRIIYALWGILIGLGLIVGAFILIFWNEEHGLHMAQSLKQAQKKLIVLPRATIDPKNNLQVVYFNGLATSHDTLTDSLLNVTLPAIQLRRSIEMYQWQQNTSQKREQQIGGSEKTVTTYTYQQVWSPTLIDSSQFNDPTGHQNPTNMPYQSMEQTAKTVTVGNFYLSPSLIQQIDNFTPVELSEVNQTSLQNRFKKPIQLIDNTLFVGSNPNSPQIGDLKIQLFAVMPEQVSIIAQQINNTLQPYLAHAGDSINLLSIGVVTPQQMISTAIEQNQLQTWVLRLVALIMMIVGVALVLHPLVILADVLPFLGGIVNFGTSLVAFIVGLILWAIATAIAWFTFRPLWAIGLLSLVAVITFLLLSKKKSAHSSETNG